MMKRPDSRLLFGQPPFLVTWAPWQSRRRASGTVDNRVGMPSGTLPVLTVRATAADLRGRRG